MYMYAPLAAVVGGSTAAAGWSSPRPRPGQRQRLNENCVFKYQMYPNPRFCSVSIYSVAAYSVACSIPRSRCCIGRLYYRLSIGTTEHPRQNYLYHHILKTGRGRRGSAVNYITVTGN